MVEPYYDRDGITIYNADCREVLPQLGAFGALITDPPYGCKRPSQRAGKRRDIEGNTSVDASWLQNVKISDRGCAYVFSCWEVLEHWKQPIAAKWNLRSCIVWDKLIHGLSDPKTCFAPRYELCLFAACGRHELKGARPADVIAVPRANETGHPYEKPVALIRKLIDISRPTSIVDPFCGSGASLVAAKLEGIQAVGIEISEEYCRMAVSRLKQNTLAFA